MAQFYADIQGNRGTATHIGTKLSGISGHIRGWNSGCIVRCHVNEKGQDVIHIYATKGSSGHGKAVTGLILTTVDGKLTFLTTKKALLSNRS